MGIHSSWVSNYSKLVLVQPSIESVSIKKTCFFLLCYSCWSLLLRMTFFYAIVEEEEICIQTYDNLNSKSISKFENDSNEKT